MSHSLHIERVISEWKVPRDLPMDSLSVDALNDLATRKLPRALAASLEQICPERDESIWLIRRLNVSLGVDLSWENDELVNRWAHGLTLNLLKTMQGDADNQSVFRYRSRTEYLAAFITDVASGTAGNRWQYASFSGLAALSSSVIVRTLLVTEPGTTLAALATLTPSTLRRVIATLSSHDATQSWMRLTHSSVPPREGLLSRVLDIWESGRGLFPSSGCPERDFLCLLALLLRKENAPENGWQESASAAAALVAVDQLIKHISAERWPEIESKVVAGKTAELAPYLPVPTNALRAWAGHPDLVKRAASAPSNGTAESARQELRSTAVGCVFLLLPLIEQLPADTWSTQPALLKFAVFVQCCSLEMRAAARADSLLRDLFGVSADLDLDRLELTVSPDAVWEWMRLQEQPAAGIEFDLTYLGRADVVSLAAHSVLRNFAWKLSGFGACSLRYLWSNFLDFSARVEIRADRIVVRMASSPLHVILRLSGLASGSYTLSGIDPRPFHLFQET